MPVFLGPRRSTPPGQYIDCGPQDAYLFCLGPQFLPAGGRLKQLPKPERQHSTRPNASHVSQVPAVFREYSAD